MTRKYDGKSTRMYANVMTMCLKAIGDLVEYPGPQLGVPDEGSRAVNRCMAATAAVSGLPAMEAAQILGHAAATIEEEPEGGGLSMIIGEALRLQAGDASLDSLEKAYSYLLKNW
ncbi:MAG: hypothetical protein OXN16_09140 [Gammaproteobacteria bacterium]|nr:hypothetical protein [Gammaproteobacteria bacterium]MDE0281226.1 hypothetical protein [Gammaproteobacteria bacterium]